jgi:hypothetical protein
MFDDVIEAHEVEAVSFVVHFLNWLRLDREKLPHVLRGLWGDFDSFRVLPTQFHGSLKEPTEPAADIQDAAGNVVATILRGFRPQFSFPAPAVFFCDEFFEVPGMGGNPVVKFFLSIDDCP